MKPRIWFSILLSLLVMSCNLISLASPVESGEPAEGEKQPLLPFAASPTPVPTPIPSTPIGLRQGLSTLNSYRLEIRTLNNGPTSRDVNEVIFLYEAASDGKNWHMSNSTQISTADEPELDTSRTDQYKVGNILCAISGEEGEAEENDVDPQAQEIMDAWYGLMDIVPVVDDPVFVAAETLNGVAVNHFRFKVSGLGVDSGAEVTASDGEYWLAVDGQYIVKYFVRLETSDGPANDPNTSTFRSEFSIEVRDINQPIEIALPAACR